MISALCQKQKFCILAYLAYLSVSLDLAFVTTSFWFIIRSVKIISISFRFSHNHCWYVIQDISNNIYRKIICVKVLLLYCQSYSNTVEPIFNDISNSDNCCYNDRFANPGLFLSLSHVIYFYNYEYKKSLSSVITTTWSESLGVKRKETR